MIITTITNVKWKWLIWFPRLLPTLTHREQICSAPSTAQRSRWAFWSECCNLHFVVWFNWHNLLLKRCNNYLGRQINAEVKGHGNGAADQAEGFPLCQDSCPASRRRRSALRRARWRWWRGSSPPQTRSRSRRWRWSLPATRSPCLDQSARESQIYLAVLRNQGQGRYSNLLFRKWEWEHILDLAIYHNQVTWDGHEHWNGDGERLALEQRFGK